jgi:hypothetical protein
VRSPQRSVRSASEGRVLFEERTVLIAQPPSGGGAGGAVGATQKAAVPSMVRSHSKAPGHGESGPHSRVQMASSSLHTPEMHSSPDRHPSPTTPRMGTQRLASPTSVQSKPSGQASASEQNVVHQLTPLLAAQNVASRQSPFSTQLSPMPPIAPRMQMFSRQWKRSLLPQSASSSHERVQ